MCLSYSIFFRRAIEKSALRKEIPRRAFLLHFHNNGEDHGIALGLFEKIGAQIIPNVTLDGVPIPTVGPLTLFQAFQRHRFQLLHQALGLFDIDKAPGDNVGPGEKPAVIGRDGTNHYDHAVLGQMFPVPKDHGSHIAYAIAVHKDPARGDGPIDTGGIVAYFLPMSEMTIFRGSIPISWASLEWTFKCRCSP